MPSSLSRAVSFWNRHWWTKLLFLAILLSILIWRAHPSHIGRSFISVDWRWMAAAVALDVGAIFLKGVDLKIVFDALGTARARTVEAFSATSIGLMINWLVPARLGEVARAYALHASLKRRDVVVPVATIFGTVLGERLFAVASIVALAFFLLVGVGVPTWARGTLIAGGIIAAGLIVALVLYERRRKASVTEAAGEPPIGATLTHLGHVRELRLAGAHLVATRLPRPHLRQRLRRQALGHLIALGESQRIMGKPLSALLEFAAQSATWIVQLIIYFFVMHAFHIGTAGVGVAALVMIATNIIGLVPITPGNWGTFQAAAVAALAIGGVGSEDALTYAIGLQGMQTLVGVTLGFVFLSIAHLSLREVEAASLATEQELEREQDEAAEP
jgi:uncharacterized membrane protein YbhN (UPF0104 family)